MNKANSLSGIYLIKNTVNGKVYIGSSCDIKKRFSCHKSQLIRGKHCNSELQREWNIYGESSFVFDIVHVAETGVNLFVVEQDYLDIYYDDGNSCYNIRPNTYSYMYDDKGLTMTRIPKSHVKALKELSEKWNTTTHDALRYMIDLGWSGYIAPEKSAKEIAARREGLK